MFWMAQEYNLPKVTSKSMRLKGGIRSTSFKQSDRGSLRSREGRLSNSNVTCGTIHVKLMTYPMSVPSGITLCQPQSIAYCTDGSKKLLEANFSMVSMPSNLTSALSSYEDKQFMTGRAFSF